MNKSSLKKCLHILDSLEIHETTIDKLTDSIQDELFLHQVTLSKAQIRQFIIECVECDNIKLLENGYDLSQAITIFSRSRNGSDTEAVSLFESVIRKIENREVLVPLLMKRFKRSDLEKAFVFPVFIDLMLDTNLILKTNSNQLYFNPAYADDYIWILDEVRQDVVCSDCVKAHYTRDLYEHKDLTYRNTDFKMINYRHKDNILKLIPQRGIPTDRDASKELQGFFKDCLFNEFNHRCCICGAKLPYMLIASHIKPFRDCAHVLEAMDQNNGLLLCRNHDFLFDQGYISFDDQGRIKISSEIIDDAEIYNIERNFQLKKKYLSDHRKAFLHYHKSTYFRKE